MMTCEAVLEGREAPLPAAGRRFTLDGCEGLERQIESDLARVTEAVLSVAEPSEVVALILGGSYGRGEGGVWREGGEDRVYDDYDLVVVTSHRSRRGRRGLHRRIVKTCEPFGREMGVELDFAFPCSQSSLPHMPFELKTLGLQHGHRVFYGPEDVLSAMPHFEPREVPLEEGARLLFSRGMGLLLSRRKLSEIGEASDEDRFFVVRNIHKAVMAMGDAVLMARGHYSPSYRRRVEILPRLAPEGAVGVPELPALYRRAVNFRFHPSHEIPEGQFLAPWLERTIDRFGRVHRWFEQRRLVRPSMDWEEYAGLHTRLPRPPWAERGVNVVRHVRAVGGAAVALGGKVFLHPRDLLMGQLAQALYLNAGKDVEKPLVALWRRFL